MTEVPKQNHLNILHVDDDSDDREFFAEAMEKMEIPYVLTSTDSCMGLMKHLEDNTNYDLIFLDINMPVIDGRQCLKEIKANEKYKNIPVIIFTVSRSERDIDDVYNSGAHFHIIKPVAHINFVASLKIIFGLNWKVEQPIPSREEFVINYAFQ